MILSHSVIAGVHGDVELMKKGRSYRNNESEMKTLVREGKAKAEQEYKNLLDEYLSFLRLAKKHFAQDLLVLIDCLFLIVHVSPPFIPTANVYKL